MKDSIRCGVPHLIFNNQLPTDVAYLLSNNLVEIRLPKTFSAYMSTSESKKSGYIGLKT
jgi:hypothetical protein